VGSLALANSPAPAGIAARVGSLALANSPAPAGIAARVGSPAPANSPAPAGIAARAGSRAPATSLAPASSAAPAGVQPSVPSASPAATARPAATAVRHFFRTAVSSSPCRFVFATSLLRVTDDADHATAERASPKPGGVIRGGKLTFPTLVSMPAAMRPAHLA